MVSDVKRAVAACRREGSVRRAAEKEARRAVRVCMTSNMGGDSQFMCVQTRCAMYANSVFHMCTNKGCHVHKPGVPYVLFERLQ